jgi:hypothetical protein
MGAVPAPPAQAATAVQAVVYLQAYLLPQQHQQACKLLKLLHLLI